MADTLVYIRNTVSGVTIAQTVEEAANILANPHFAQYHVIVDAPKSEVLAQPYRVDDEGNRSLIEPNAGSEQAPSTNPEGETAQ